MLGPAVEMRHKFRELFLGKVLKSTYLLQFFMYTSSLIQYLQFERVLNYIW